MRLRCELVQLIQDSLLLRGERVLCRVLIWDIPHLLAHKATDAFATWRDAPRRQNDFAKVGKIVREVRRANLFDFFPRWVGKNIVDFSARFRRFADQCGLNQGMKSVNALGQKRCQNYFSGVDAGAIFLGRPRGRVVRSSLSRSAKRFNQASSPYGRPRLTERRIASSCGSASGSWTR